VQQRVEGAGHAAAGTVQPGEPVKLADGIKRVGGWVEKENDGGGSQPGCRQEDAREPRIGRGNFGRSRVHSNRAAMPVQTGRRQRELKNSQAEIKQQADRRANQSRQRQPPAGLFLRLTVDLHQRDDGKNQAKHIERAAAAAHAGKDATNQAGCRKTIGIVR